MFRLGLEEKINPTYADDEEAELKEEMPSDDSEDEKLDGRDEEELVKYYDAICQAALTFEAEQ